MHPTMSDGDYTGWRMGSGFVAIGPHSDVHGKNDAPGHSAMRREGKRDMTGGKTPQGAMRAATEG